MEFNAVIRKDDSGRLVCISIPFDAKKEFSKPKGTIYVKGTLNTIPFRSKLISRGGGVQILIIDKKLQKALGFNGDEIEVAMTTELDEANVTEFSPPKMIENCSMNVLEAISSRTSIRRFSDKAVENIQLDTILNAGFCAPSAKNKRPFHFVVVRNKTLLEKLSEGSSDVKMLTESPCAIAVCGDKAVQGINEFLIEDCSAAVQNILLAAHAIGLGAVWCGVVRNSEWYKLISSALVLPDKIVPIAVIALGHPDKKRTATKRFEPAKVHFEKW